MSVSPQSTPRESRSLSPQGVARREELLEAALAVMARKGFHDTSIADIAALGRASRATVYLYFRDKRDILAAIARRVELRLLGAIDTWVPLPASPDTTPRESRPCPLVDQLQRMIDARITQVMAAITANADAARLVLRLERGHDGVVDDTVRRIDAYIIGTLTKDIEAAIANGWARRCDANMMARYLLGGIEKLVIAALDAERQLEIDLAAVEREIGAFIFFGLAHPTLLRQSTDG
jgi:AcrR family transcriptional regulator